MGHPGWPLFDLRVRTERLELRPPTDDDVAALLAASRRGIHDPAEMPFSTPWTDAESPAFERRFFQHFWRTRADWRPESWAVGLMVVHDGEAAGSQSIEAKDFAVLRQVSTGSWLAQPFQGQGLGKEMRAAVLHLAFAGLGAEVAYSAAFVDNPASLGVSRALGYEDNGRRREAPRGEPRDIIELCLTRARWEARTRIDVEIEGLDHCLDMFGASPPGA